MRAIRGGSILAAVLIPALVQPVRAAPSAPRPLWTSVDRGRIVHRETATSVAFGPRGQSVFVAGPSAQGTRPNRKVGVTTIAYDASSGAERWTSKELLGSSSHRVALVAVSDGRVIVAISGGGIAVVAYSQWTGRRLWQSGFVGPDQAFGYPNDIAISPDGSSVYIAGSVDEHYATLAFDASTGARRWIQFEPNGSARGLAVSPDSERVYVTGVRNGARQPSATFALDAATGKPAWKSATPARHLALSPDGSLLYLSNGPTAMRTFDGSTAWSGHRGDGSGDPIGIDVGPRGLRLYVASTSADGSVGLRSFSARSGRVIWAKGIEGSFRDLSGLAASTSRVFLLGNTTSSSGGASDTDIETVSLRADTGAERWRTSFGWPDTPDEVGALALSPHAARFIVTGTRTFVGGSDFETAAYPAKG